MVRRSALFISILGTALAVPALAPARRPSRPRCRQHAVVRAGAAPAAAPARQDSGSGACADPGQGSGFGRHEKGDSIKLPGNIVFDTGKATLKAGSGSDVVLGQLKQFLYENPQITKLRVEGHTDNVGQPDANMTLSGQRALTIKTWLVSHGIKADRILAVGFGQTKPIADTRRKRAAPRTAARSSRSPSSAARSASEWTPPAAARCSSKVRVSAWSLRKGPPRAGPVIDRCRLVGVWSLRLVCRCFHAADPRWMPGRRPTPGRRRWWARTAAAIQGPMRLPVRPVLSLLALLLLPAACSRAPSDLRVWKPSDHDRAEENSNAQAAAAGTDSPDLSQPAKMLGVDQVVLVAWRQNCTRCHGMLGQGDGPQGAMFGARNLSDPAWQASVTDADSPPR